MPATTHEEEKPVALIVEDQPSTLTSRKRIFNTHGFQAIGAKSKADALREFRASPTIDIVVTDINLVGSDEADKSGVDLAREIRSRRPTVPVIALSGRFDDLDADEKLSFNGFLLKGAFSVAQLEANLTDWKNQALRYRQARAQKARQDLQQFREDRPLPNPDVELLQDFLPGSHMPTRTDDPTNERDDPDGIDDEFLDPDEILRRAGWRLQLVEAGFQLSEFEDMTVKTGIAIPLWLREELNTWIAVLHGHPCIYHDAPTQKEVVEGALALMLGYHRTFTETPQPEPTDELKNLRNYLKQVFGDLYHAGNETRSKPDNAEAGR